MIFGGQISQYPVSLSNREFNTGANKNSLFFPLGFGKTSIIYYISHLLIWKNMCIHEDGLINNFFFFKRGKKRNSHWVILLVFPVQWGPVTHTVL